MYPQVFAATFPSCRLSLRNHIRNDVNALIKAMRGDDRSQDAVLYFAQIGTDEAAGIVEQGAIDQKKND